METFFKKLSAVTSIDQTPAMNEHLNLMKIYANW